jgi:hypothetical protein
MISEKHRREGRIHAMVKTMNIECPSCSQHFRLYLSIDTSMVILDCPMCSTSIISYKSQTFTLSKRQLERIKGCKQESNVLKILHKITTDGLKVPCEHSYVRHCHARDEDNPVQRSSLDHISHDDIINLRIELETCRDCASFIERI